MTMTRWMRLLAAVTALGTAPALAAETGAEKKDRKHEEQLRERLDRRENEKAKGAGAKVKKGADQAGDAARLGGARAARTYHKGVHAGKKVLHKGAKKTADVTE